MGTFHGICVRILRQDAEYIGIPKNFLIFDEGDSLTLIKKVCKQLQVNEKQYSPKVIKSIISSSKNQLIEPAEYLASATTPVQKIVAKIFPVYNQGLADHQALDFDDIILKTIALLEADATVLKKWSDQFKYILIDEYQDTNLAQYRLIKLLTNKNHNICVVGDDWQSIYSWRGADFTNILNFERDYPKANVIKLEQNYRSTKYILDAAHKVINKNRMRSSKKLWTSLDGGLPVQIISVLNERAEGEAIIRRIQTSVNLKTKDYNDFAVLYRTNAQSRSLEEQFIRFGVPYKIVGGVRFYDRAEIKDVLSYLRLIYQPEDLISFSRIINIPSRGIGAKSLQTFSDWRALKSLSLQESLEKVNEAPLNPRIKQQFLEFGRTLVDFRTMSEELAVADLTEKLLARLGYLEYLKDGTIQGESRIENVKELLSVAKAYSEVGLDSFLEEVALISDLDQLDERQNAVTLMTLHSAKGLEFPVVFMPGLEESLLPHGKAVFDLTELEEERRLCYVGMTRAKQELYLLYATSRIIYGNLQYNPPSRFLNDIDEHFESSSLLGYVQNTAETNSSNVAIEEPRYILELNEGDKVRHQMFGIGVVLKLDGEDATVHFKGKGTKKLNLAYAPLEKI